MANTRCCWPREWRWKRVRPKRRAFTWTWVEVEDLARLYKTIGSNGFVHHASMIYGDQTEALKDACYFLDIEVVEAQPVR